MSFRPEPSRPLAADRGISLVSTSRLDIRRFTKNDARDYFEIFGNPNICRFDDFDPINKEGALNDIKKIIANYDSGAVEHEYAVELQYGARVIGVLSTREEDSAIYVGYHFNEHYHGKGYALEAMAAFLPWLRNNTRLAILAVTDPRNERSIHLLKKIGFEFMESVSRTVNGTEATEWVYRFDHS